MPTPAKNKAHSFLLPSREIKLFILNPQFHIMNILISKSSKKHRNILGAGNITANQNWNKLKHYKCNKKIANAKFVLTECLEANTISWLIRPLPLAPGFHMDTGSNPSCSNSDPVPRYWAVKTVENGLSAWAPEPTREIWLWMALALATVASRTMN